VIEEKRAMTAKQILHVVLRGRERNVDMGFVHQTIEQIVVKGQRRGILLLDGSQHGRLLHPVRADAIPVGPKGKKRAEGKTRSPSRCEASESAARPPTNAALTEPLRTCPADYRKAR
jgi:hypothetical protein